MTGYMIGLSIGIAGMILVTAIHIRHEQEMAEEIEKLRSRRMRPVMVEPIIHCPTPRMVKGVMVAKDPEEGADLWTDF